MDLLTDPRTWIAFLTLVSLELVLGVDNVIFFSILAGKLPAEQQSKARRTGLALAVLSRILLLFSLSWIIGLTEPLFDVFGFEVSGRDIILLLGGLFLMGKATYEIHEKLESMEHSQTAKIAASFISVIIQIILVDIVFSLDSVITAVGISGHLAVMIPAVVIAAAVMLFAAGGISSFVEKHPTMKILALAFLILIGVMLVIEGWSPDLAHELHLKNYAYFAMAFSFLVELVNMRLRPSSPHTPPVHLHNQPSMEVETVPANNQPKRNKKRK